MTQLGPIDLFNQAGLSFHEATVVSFTWIGCDIELTCKGVTSNSGLSDAILKFEMVRSCRADGKRRDGPLMEAPDAELLSIRGTVHGFEMVLEWNDFNTHTSWARHYHIEADVIRLA